MQTFTTTDAEKNFDEVLDQANHEPIGISENGQPVAFIISSEEFKRLEKAHKPSAAQEE